MNIKILKTTDIYKQMVNQSKEERKELFINEMMMPFKEMYTKMHMPMDIDQLSLHDLNDTGGLTSKINLLNQANYEALIEDALLLSVQKFHEVGLKTPKEVTVGVLIGDYEKLKELHGYVGMGSIPGYILLIISPTTDNIKKLSAVTAHEFHHNIRALNTTDNFMDISVAEYLAVEGLAESMSKELYGDSSIGPWVKNHTKESLDKSKPIIKEALDIKGFMNVRKYIFGDLLMSYDKSEKTGLPPMIGYAIGYYAVQAYLKKNKLTVAEASKLPYDMIIKDSGYF